MDPLERLEALGQFRMKLGLGRIRRLMSELGDPQSSVPSIHVAGTNGKGSTCHLIDSIMSEFPFGRALYTSPHLIDISERLRFDGENIESDVLRTKISSLFDLSDELFPEDDQPTYFEMITSAFFSLSAEMDSDINTVEVGMGGRFDATNILEPLATGLTSVSLDHQEYLGDEEHLIAREKAGIIKPSTPVVIGPIHSGDDGSFRVLKTILEICTENGSPAVIIDPDGCDEELIDLMESRAIPDGRIISLSDIGSDEFHVSAGIKVIPLKDNGPFLDHFAPMDLVDSSRFEAPLCGVSQVYNMIVAVCLSLLALPGAHSRRRLRTGHLEAIEDLLDGSPESFMNEYQPDEIIARIRKGLSKVRIPARMETVKMDGFDVIFDGGHNQEAARSLGKSISKFREGRRFPLLMTMMKGKDPSSYAKGISEIVSSVVVTELSGERCLSSEETASGMARELPSRIDIHIRKDLETAYDLWLNLVKEAGSGMAGGSFYLYSPFMELVRRPT
jgi:folylpolyglutamate synthase/dihydropteroate synthase